MDAVKNAAQAQLAQLRAKIDDNELLHSLEVSSATTNDVAKNQNPFGDAPNNEQLQQPTMAATTKRGISSSADRRL